MARFKIGKFRKMQQQLENRRNYEKEQLEKEYQEAEQRLRKAQAKYEAK
ncbi:hypothetical protein NX029_26160 [Cytobacillus firmus]|nr:hypothetical protein [Cytobacillus firmus]